jgi:zinc D-Ala-D-Ala dipeptidase
LHSYLGGSKLFRGSKDDFTPRRRRTVGQEKRGNSSESTGNWLRCVGHKDDHDPLFHIILSSERQRSMITLDRPIPIVEQAPTSSDYHDVPINVQDARCQEALVDARRSGLAGENYYSRTDGQNAPYYMAISGAVRELWCRDTIVKMLTKVNELLAAYGAELFLWDAYRPIACQRGLWDFFERRVRSAMPHVDEVEVARWVEQYVSNPRFFDLDNPKTWPAHTTGAAIDLTLRDLRSGKLLDMGSHFDEMSPASHSDFFERLLNLGEIGSDDVRLVNRRLLYWAMRDQGFTNYSYEFWHFDYGNQMYIMTLRHFGIDARAAWYGYIALPNPKVSRFEIAEARTTA